MSGAMGGLARASSVWGSALNVARGMALWLVLVGAFVFFWAWCFAATLSLEIMFSLLQAALLWLAKESSFSGRQLAERAKRALSAMDEGSQSLASLRRTAGWVGSALYARQQLVAWAGGLAIKKAVLRWAVRAIDRRPELARYAWMAGWNPLALLFYHTPSERDSEEPVSFERYCATGPRPHRFAGYWGRRLGVVAVLSGVFVSFKETAREAIGSQMKIAATHQEKAGVAGDPTLWERECQSWLDAMEAAAEGAQIEEGLGRVGASPARSALKPARGRL